MFCSTFFLGILAISAQASPPQERTTWPIPSSTDLRKIDTAFYASKLVPDIVSSIKSSLLINAAYGTHAVNLGNTFRITETLKEPTISITAEINYDPSSTKYTVLGNFVHFIVSDVKPSYIATQKWTTLAMYKPLTPAGVAQHRYTFLVYRQPKHFKPNIIEAQSFLGQPLSVFVASSGLQGPVGGNFFKEGALNV